MTDTMHRRVALVTGAGSEQGIGFATALALAEAGCAVYLTSTTDRCLMRAAALRDMGHDAAASVADLTDENAVSGLVDRVLSAFGRIDVLVNNAGMTSVGDPMVQPLPAHTTSPEAWTHTLLRNLMPTYLVTRAVLPHMVQGGYGRIVNVASTTGVSGAMLGESAYASAKAGITGFTRATALEYAAHGITVNAVAPGWIATASQTADEQRQGRATPLGRSGAPAEVAHIIAMLAAPGAGYTTGQCVIVDGGNGIAEERA